MKKVIINADDFGLCRGVNEGIILAHQQGILTSATLMANAPGFEQAVDLARQNTRLGVGIHLNIIRGQPVALPEKVKSLLSSKGYFLGSVYAFLRKLIFRKIELGEVEKEFRAQIEKVSASKLPISHLDSEKHMHTIPALFKIVLKLGKEYGIPRMRYINEYCLSFRLGQCFKSIAISLSCFFMKKRIREHGIIAPDRFYGICQSGRMSALQLKKILMKLESGASEIMVHPGFMTEELIELEKKFGSYYINNRREGELKALMEPELKQIIQDQKILLINFSEL
jgi:hopanoid biosynthesis associated protein HpnK